ncbi:MAG TPA: diacylglycerol kinase family protein [Gaiellaceae bacterium]|jgi:diacylglycerol kinase family enzyme|nr:diacylglycerol kinase family protein [Gaiellaceae bacterium]
MNIVLIVNPFASRVSEDGIASVERALARAGTVETILTERPRHATELVADAARRRSEAIVVFSGDGGFNEALNGLHADVPVGFLPGGGTSVLPRALGLPHDPATAAAQVADAIGAGRTRRITLGSVNGRRFAFAAGVGLDAEAVRRVDEMGRGSDGRRPGDLAFARAVVRAIASNRGHVEPALEVVGLGRAAFAFVANGSPYTYAKRIAVQLVPDADFELGLDVVAPVRIRRRSLPWTAYALLRGHPWAAEVLLGHDLDRVEIVCDGPMPLQADGEDLGDVERVVFEAQRGAVAVLT